MKIDEASSRTDPAREPTSEMEAREMAAALAEEVASIQNQLADMNRTRPDGARMSAFEWNEWRRRALRALQHKQAELRRVRNWIHLRSHETESGAKCRAWQLLLRCEPHVQDPAILAAIRAEIPESYRRSFVFPRGGTP